MRHILIWLFECIVSVLVFQHRQGELSWGNCTYDYICSTVSE